MARTARAGNIADLNRLLAYPEVVANIGVALHRARDFGDEDVVKLHLKLAMSAFESSSPSADKGSAPLIFSTSGKSTNVPESEATVNVVTSQEAVANNATSATAVPNM